MDVYLNNEKYEEDLSCVPVEGDMNLSLRQGNYRKDYLINTITKETKKKYLESYIKFGEQVKWYWDSGETDYVEGIKSKFIQLYATDESTVFEDIMDFLDLIEDTLPRLKRICSKPISHLRSNNEIRPIDTVKRIGYESIPYLASHSEDWQARTASGDLTAQLFNGYAAIEQYGFEGQQGAWTDIYAFGAVLYRALIGSDPLDAKSRAINDRLMVPGKFAEQLPAYVINGLINALQIMPEDRTHTAEQLRAELSASPTAAVAGEVFEATGKFPVRQPTQTGIEAQAAKRKAEAERLAIEKKKRNILILKTCGISLAVGLLLFLILSLTVFRDTIWGGRSNAGETTTQVMTTAGDEFYTVPQFVDQPYSRFSGQAVWSERFQLDVTYEFSDKVESGIIISQSVAAGTDVKKGTRIELVVSKGVEQITMIDIVGQTYDVAEKKLTELGFVCVVNEQENDGTHLESVVISANLEVGKSYPKGTKVYIKIWGKTATEAAASGNEDDEIRSIFNIFG